MALSAVSTPPVVPAPPVPAPAPAPAPGPGPAPAPAPSQTTPAPPAGPPKPAGLGMKWDKPFPMDLKPGISYEAELATSDGKIGVQLLAGAAPQTVNNFRALAQNHFYDGSPSHRLIPDFMAQFGDPTGTGTGGPGYTIPDEKVPPTWHYNKYVVAMANTGQPNTGGSQFFIMTGHQDLPPTYTIFGYVNNGRDVVDKINARKVIPNEMGAKPADPLWIDTVTIKESPIVATKEPAPPAPGTPAPPVTAGS